MANHLSTDRFGLLSLCAILRSFDRALLGALAEHDEGEIAALLASDLVVPVSGPGGTYRLRPEVQADVLAQFRVERPFDELALHTRAFNYFMERMEQPGASGRRPDDEERCFYHLDNLFSLHSQRLEWQVIRQHTSRARALGARRARYRQRLALYHGHVAIRTQKYDRGRALLTALLDQPDLEDDVRVRALLGLGWARWYQTQYDRALALFQQTYALALETGNRLYQGLALINMSAVYNELGYYDQALDANLRSLRIFREQHEPVREAHALYRVGINAMYLGRWPVAQDHFDQAITLFEALRIVDGLALLYWSQGHMHHMLGHETESEAAYLRALSLSHSPEHPQPTVALDVLSDLGFLYQTQERWDAALAYYEQALELATRLGREHLANLIRYQRGNALKRLGRLDEMMAAYRQAIDGVEALRGAIEDEELKIGLLGTTQQLYESMVLQCLDCDLAVEAFAYAERARSRAFLDTLASKSPDLYDALLQPAATLAEVQARLPPDALLLEYFTTGVIPRGEHLINKLPPENVRLREHITLPPQTLIFAVTRDRFEVYRVALDPNTLRPMPGDPGPGRRLLRERLLVLLHERLIAPVRHLLRGRRLLYLIPHGPLHYVPFMALRSAGGDYLLDAGGPAIALAPSATILLHNCLGRPPSHAADFFALGYNGDDPNPLRYAEVEARRAARLMGGHAWTGRAPKSQHLIAVGPRARWLHVAGHALYEPHDPLGSALRLGVDDLFSARAIIGGLDLDADLVTLSACTSGISHVVPGDELLGLQRAFLYAGARAVVCTLWEAADFVALLVMDRFYADVRQGRRPAAALRDAQVAVRAMSGRELMATLERWRAEDPDFVAALGELPIVPPEQLDSAIYADPFYWAPFMLIGQPWQG